jgi:hypothetical protein
MRRVSSALATAVVLLGMSGPALACPMCKDSVPNSDAEKAESLPAGFNNGVYFTLGGFLTMVGFVSYVIVKGVRSSNAATVSRDATRRAFPVTEMPRDALGRG